jgi:hypothetical protein
MPTKNVHALERRSNPRFSAPGQTSLWTNVSESVRDASFINISFSGALMKIKGPSECDWAEGKLVFAKPTHRTQNCFLYRIRRIHCQSRRITEIGCQRIIGPFADRRIRALRMKEREI